MGAIQYRVPVRGLPCNFSSWHNRSRVYTESTGARVQDGVHEVSVEWLPWGDVVGVASIIVIVGGGQELLTLPPCMGVFLRWFCRVSPHVPMCGAVLQFPTVLRADPDGLPGIVVDLTE